MNYTINTKSKEAHLIPHLRVYGELTRKDFIGDNQVPYKNSKNFQYSYFYFWEEYQCQSILLYALLRKVIQNRLHIVYAEFIIFCIDAVENYRIQ